MMHPSRRTALLGGVSAAFVGALPGSNARAEVGVRPPGGTALAVEITIGAVVYAISALTVARSASLDLLAVVRRVRQERFGASA